VSIINYNLQIQSPFNNFNPQTVLSDSNNLQSLEAALTSMLQKDSITTGSVVEINTPVLKSDYRKRRQTYDITCNVNITSNKPTTSTVNLNQYHSHVDYLLSNSNKTTSFVHYQESNSTPVYWLTYDLPQTIQSSKISY
jgi:hypothetical protein